jgi:CBS domain-containing protein
LIHIKDGLFGSMNGFNHFSGVRAMNAADIMVTNVITASPEQSVLEVAETLLANHISGMPVVDATGKLVGIISEGDLMRRAEADTDHRRSWWLQLLMGREGLAAEYIKEHSRKVCDVMSRRVVTAAPDTPVGEIAELLERNGIKRVPILQEGKIVGIVSRANLLLALVKLRKQLATESPVADSILREAIIERLEREPWSRTSLINVEVHDGTVDLRGIVISPVEKKALRVAAEVTPGVRKVNDSILVWPNEEFGRA